MKLISVDLESPLPDVAAPAVGEQWVLVRLHGHPVGILPLARRAYDAGALARLVRQRLSSEILRHLVHDGLCTARAEPFLDLGELPGNCPRRVAGDRLPLLTAAVCTRDGHARLPECLDALISLDYPAGRLDLLVVDNAPRDDRVRQLVADRYPAVRYVQEPVPGLDRARNRAIAEARGEIVAFSDDDVSVDRGWARAIAGTFLEEPAAVAVTGLVVPDETDTRAQLLFEAYGGFGRGVRRRYYQIDRDGGELAAPRHGGAGKFGTGANMAFRREVLAALGGFDPALDVGTVTNGGGDLEMFFRVIKEGHLLVYEPTAIVRHRHRRAYDALRIQLANNGTGFYAYLVRSAHAYPDERRALARLGTWWFLWWNVRRLAQSVVRPGAFPRDLVLAELAGSLVGLLRYPSSRRRSPALEATGS